ncbi:MAG: hypothetical protein ACI8PB_002984 [Desulforhopalus sp.]|jgi:hypothetical protein
MLLYFNNALDMTTTLFKNLKIPIITCIFALLINQSSWASQADFSWLPNNTTDGTVGYMLHYGTSSRQYTESVDVGSPVPINGLVCASVLQLAPGQTYFFTVTAYNAQGYQSAYPNEVVYTAPNDYVNNDLYDIYMSTSSNLSGAVSLEGSTFDGDIFVFTGPDSGVSSVTFSVDGVVARLENNAPYELVGGAAFDTSQLSVGQHEITAKIQLSDGSTQQVSGLFNTSSAEDSPVDPGNSSYDILVSTSSTLSGAFPLDGATANGELYIFTGPDTGVSRVTFSVDGAVTKLENNAPFELAGGNTYDVSQLSPGQHEITAKIQLSDGSSSELVSAVFTIPSIDDDPVNENYHDILVSASPNRSGAIALDGTAVDGDIFVFTGPDTGVSSVIFSVDGAVTRQESNAPFDLVGGAAFDTSQLSPGLHEITAEIQLDDGGTELISAIFDTSSFTDSPANDSRCDLLVSDTRYLSGATPLNDSTVNGDIYVFTGPDTDVSSVTFSVDGTVTKLENWAPFELVGGAAFNTSQLSKGMHQIVASIEFTDGGSEEIAAEFDVQ